VLAQMIGQDVPELVRTARALFEYDEVAGIDLNLGCPAPTVCSKQAGGALLKNGEKIHRILGSLREACGERKFTVKTRLGFDEPGEFAGLLDIFARHEIDLLSIHGRTVKERYQTPVHTEEVRAAVELLECPVVANGNVVDVASGRNYLARTGAAGLMIGRGAIRNPWLFGQLRDSLQGVEPYRLRRCDLLTYCHLLWEETAQARVELGKSFDEKKHVHKMKRYLNYIVAGLGEELEYGMKRSQEKEELFALLTDFLDNKDPVPDLPPERSKLFCGFRELL
jgi:tRNA-dihydrouridine synthase C